MTLMGIEAVGEPGKKGQLTWSQAFALLAALHPNV